MLELRNVSKDFSGIKAVDDVSFRAHSGQEVTCRQVEGSSRRLT